MAAKSLSLWAPPSLCPSPTPPFSDDDDLPFEDCLEELPSTTSSGIALPPELIEEVLRWTQAAGFDCQADLRRFSLVSRAWAPPARRILFGQTLSIVDEDAVRRLRAALVSSPELASHVRRIDLSNSSCTWRYQNMHDVFRRAAGILRQTVRLKEISLLQIPLSPKVRGKLFGALQAIGGVETASFYSSSGYHGRGPTTALDCPDASALALLLCRWKNLKSLTLSNYAEYPFALCSDSLPAHTIPTYHLDELSISSSDLSASLLWILGNSQHTLRRLHLAATIGLTSSLLSHLFLLLGNTLTDLSLAIDRDDFATPPSDALPGSILAPLVRLETLSVTTDSSFKDDLLEYLGSVEKLEVVMLCFPAFRYAPIEAFLRRDSPALRELTLDTWDSGEIWTDHQRFVLASLCESKRVAIFLNGQSASIIEDVWYGEDISEDWAVMEEGTWPTQSTSPSGPPSIAW